MPHPRLVSATGGMANEATLGWQLNRSAVQLDNVLATLPAHFSLHTLVSYPVHKGCLLQLWSCSQVPV